MAHIVIGNILDEVLLALAGGLDGRRLLDGLGAAAGKEEDAAEHRAEDAHGELFCAACQLLYFFLHFFILHCCELCKLMRNPHPSHVRAERVCRPRA